MGIKVFWSAVVIVCIVIAYVLLAAIQPAINDLVSSANASTGNWSNAWGAQETLNFIPWFVWFIPALVGGFFIFLILRVKKSGR